MIITNSEVTLNQPGSSQSNLNDPGTGTEERRRSVNTPPTIQVQEPEPPRFASSLIGILWSCAGLNHCIISYTDVIRSSGGHSQSRSSSNRRSRHPSEASTSGVNRSSPHRSAQESVSLLERKGSILTPPLDFLDDVALQVLKDLCPTSSSHNRSIQWCSCTNLQHYLCIIFPHI